MTTTTIALIRHGQTDWNRERRIQGHTDIPLNPTGIAQAEAAVLHLADEPWDGLFTSPLGRAAHTARVIATGLGLSAPTQHPGFLERHFGQAEGLIAGPGLDAVRGDGPGEFLGAETPTQVSARGIAALDGLLESHRGKRLLVVSHGACIRITLRELLGIEIPGIENAVRSQLEHDGSGWRLTHLNGTHLPDPVETASPPLA